MFSFVKFGVQAIATLGVTRVVAEVIKNNTTVVSTLDKVLVNTGGFVIGTIIVDHATDRISYAFDKFSDWSEQQKEEVKEAAEKIKNGDKDPKSSS